MISKDLIKKMIKYIFKRFHLSFSVIRQNQLMPHPLTHHRFR